MSAPGSRRMRLGVFGGTFNPIHLGHLLLAETARERLALDRVLFIPTRQPPHKSARGLLPGAQRLALIRLAIQGQPAFVASDIELRRAGPSYSIETVNALRATFPDARLFLLIGQDMLAVRWRAWDELKRRCTVVVAHRPESQPVGRERGLTWLPMPQLDISSSDIRTHLARGRSIRYLVPPAVERSLVRQRCYRSARP